MAELELLTGWLAGQQRGGWPLLWIGQLGLCHLGVEEQEADQVVHNRASLLCHKQDISLNSVGHHLVGKDIELPVNHHCCLSPLVLQFACYHITGCVYYEDALWVVWNAQSKVSGSIMNSSRKEPFFLVPGRSCCPHTTQGYFVCNLVLHLQKEPEALAAALDYLSKSGVSVVNGTLCHDSSNPSEVDQYRRKLKVMKWLLNTRLLNCTSNEYKDEMRAIGNRRLFSLNDSR